MSWANPVVQNVGTSATTAANWKTNRFNKAGSNSVMNGSRKNIVPATFPVKSRLSANGENKGI